MKAMSAILGCAVASPHGIIVGSVAPDSSAAEAGILPGDSITACDGKIVTCPSTLLPRLKQGEEPRQVELTLRRRKTDQDDAEPPAAHETEPAENTPGGEEPAEAE
jgi:S1-C subfamily serine protease